MCEVGGGGGGVSGRLLSDILLSGFSVQWVGVRWCSGSVYMKCNCFNVK